MTLTPAVLTRIAYHEAGHAVVALSLDCGLNYVSITPEGGIAHIAYRGQHVSDYVDSIITIAGIVAERTRFFGLPGFDDPAEDYDEISAFVPHLSEQQQYLWFKNLRREAAKLLWRQWAAVEALAKAIATHEYLTGEQVQAIVEEARPHGAAGLRRHYKDKCGKFKENWLIY